MRNKEQFVNDVGTVANSLGLVEVNFVEDAAHTLNNDTDNYGEYTIVKDFTTTGQDETFVFIRKSRPATDDPNVMLDDWYYEGRK